MADPLVEAIVNNATALKEAGREQGRAEAQQEFLGQAVIRLSAGLFASSLGAAVQMLRSYSPEAADFFAAKAREFQAFAEPPSVTNVSPAQDAANVAINDQVVVQFAVPMDEASLTDDTVYIGAASGGAHLATETSYDATSRALTLVPANGLSPGVTYRVTVTKEVRSGSGQSMGTDFTYTFTTTP